MSGARAKVVLENELGNDYVIESVILSIDESTIYEKIGGEFARKEEIPVFEGNLPAGSHLLLVSLVYVSGTWYLGVQSLDAAAIRDPSRRLVYLSVAVPAAYAGSVTLVVLTASVVWEAFDLAPAEIDPVGLLVERRWIFWSVYALLWLGLILARQAAQWVARSAPPWPNARPAD
jgi:hypothetical protein